MKNHASIIFVDESIKNHVSIRFVDGWMKNHATLGLWMDELRIT